MAVQVRRVPGKLEENGKYAYTIRAHQYEERGYEPFAYKQRFSRIGMEQMIPIRPIAASAGL